MGAESDTGDGSRPRIVHIDDAPRRDMHYERGYKLRLVDDGVGAERIDVHINVIAAGDPGGPYHLHTQTENVYIVLEGEATLTLEDGEHVATPGTVVFIPPGAPHGVRNSGDGELKLIEIYAPPDPDFYELER